MRGDRPLEHYAARLDGRAVGIASAFTASSTLTLTLLAVPSWGVVHRAT
ncbi:MAG: hypothetical protein ACRDL4_13555 [Thermoleophilaceae bacterium]